MELIALGPKFGVEVRGIGLIDVTSSDSVYRATRAALEEHSILVVRKNRVTHRQVRGNIGDAVRQGSTWHGRRMILRGDGANLDAGSRDRWTGDLGRLDPAPCADARYCSEESRNSALIVDAIRTAESANPNTRAQSCR
jgi:hypothetical protein